VSNGSEKGAWGLDAWWGGECGFFLPLGASLVGVISPFASIWVSCSGSIAPNYVTGWVSGWLSHWLWT
jgi:hypothetical protein